MDTIALAEEIASNAYDMDEYDDAQLAAVVAAYPTVSAYAYTRATQELAYRDEARVDAYLPDRAYDH